MTLQFTKMNGAGNDFVVIDNRDLSVQLTGEQIARLCDRHRGVGADGRVHIRLAAALGSADDAVGAPKPEGKAPITCHMATYPWP